MAFTETSNGSLVFRNAWDADRFEDDPSVGDPFRGEQATMAARWDVRTWWKELSRRHGLTQNEALVAVELWAEALGAGRWTNYSRSDEHYAKFPKSVLYTKRLICGGVDGLEKKGLVLSWRQVKFGFGWQSCVKATPDLVAMVQEVVSAIGRPYPARPKSELLLRDADGKPLPLPDTIETRKMISELWDYNSLLQASLVDGQHATCVRRVFNEFLRFGGRHYCIGLSYQRKTNFERALMTINGERVVEYDYGSLHPCLLYAMAGLPIPEDAYDLEWWDRDLQKVGFLVMVNCDDPEVALHAIAEKPAMAVVAEPGSPEALRVAAALYDELADRHRKIADMFSTGIGRVLQRKDSDMMAVVMREMTKARALVLPVFDSGITAETNEDLLKGLMRKVADRAKLDGIRIEKVVPKVSESKGSDSSGVPAYVGPAARMSCLMPSLPFLPTPPQDMAQKDAEGSRRDEAEAPLFEPVGRPSFSPAIIPFPTQDSLQESLLAPSIPVSDSSCDPAAEINARRIDSGVDPSEFPSEVESPTGLTDVAQRAPSAVRALHSMPWDRSSIIASLDLRRHDRAVAAAQAVAGPAVSPDLDWSSHLGFGLAQHTNHGATWTWSLPGRRECVVHLWNAAGETVLAVADQMDAGRVVETYLRTLAGDGPRLRIDVTYAGRYDLSLSVEENVALHRPVSDVLRRPSLVVGAPDTDEDEPPFQIDHVWFDDEDLPLVA